MSLIVEDLFNDTQANNTSSNVGAWLPVGTRTTAGLGTAVSDVNTTVLQTWFFSKTAGGSIPTLTYDFVATNFASSVGIILLEDITVTSGAPTYSLTLFDGTTSQTLAGIPVANDVLWSVNAFVAVNTANIVQMTFAVDNAGAASGNVATLSSTIVCLGRDTSILMADQSTMMIQDLKRGDVVAGHDGSGHKIARVIHSTFQGNYKIDIVKIEKEAIDSEVPDRDTLISGWHPILHKGVRKPAKCFINFKGVQHWYHTINAGDILSPDDDTSGYYSLYNLQFDHEVLFIANNLVVQAVSPHSRIMPLPKDLFFDQEKIDRPLVSESYITDSVWDDSVIASEGQTSCCLQ